MSSRSFLYCKTAEYRKLVLCTAFWVLHCFDPRKGIICAKIVHWLKGSAQCQDHMVSLELLADCATCSDLGFDRWSAALQTILSPGTLGTEAVVSLLAQWAQQDHRLILLSTVKEFADKITAVCNGHSGLVGLCCNRLAAEFEEAAGAGRAYSPQEFERYLSWSLPSQLQMLSAYRYRIMHSPWKAEDAAFKKVHSPSPT